MAGEEHYQLPPISSQEELTQAMNVILGRIAERLKFLETENAVDILKADTTLSAGQAQVFVDAIGGAITITLPKSIDNIFKRLFIKKIDSSANVVTISAGDGVTIDDVVSKTLTSQYDVLTLTFDGTEWWIL